MTTNPTIPTSTSGAPPARSTEETELWVKAYQGEVFGEAYFARMAEHTADPDRRVKVEALATLERRTKELLEPALSRLGLRTDADRNLAAMVSGGADFDYDQMLVSVPPLAAEYLLSYARLRRLVAPEDFHVVDQLIAHELALELFAFRERAGDIERSLEPIRALVHVGL